jgi:hypothetical protein
MELCSRAKQNKALVNMKWGGENDVKPSINRAKNDIEWTNSLCDGMIGVMSFLRTSVCNVVFEVYTKSLAQANDK